jgi:glutamate synthase (ferredoxin)
VGDHGCEYMTGGRVVVLGSTGRNFAAGMSGGVAYVLDEAGDFSVRCNQQAVALERLENPAEMEQVRLMIQRHGQHTRSRRALDVLARWEEMTPKFVKVMPKDYKRMLQAIATAEQAGLSGDEALMAAFDANARDLARIDGG